MSCGERTPDATVARADRAERTECTERTACRECTPTPAKRCQGVIGVSEDHGRRRRQPAPILHAGPALESPQLRPPLPALPDPHVPHDWRRLPVGAELTPAGAVHFRVW